MEYEKIINLLDNTPNQPCKFKIKNWVEINDESWGTYNKDNQVRFKTSMLNSSLCDYSDAYIPVKRTITVRNAGVQDEANNATNKKVIFKKNSGPFTNCISRINNTQVDDADDIDLVMPMCNVIEYSNNYSKAYGILWQYCRDEQALDENNHITDFTVANSITDLFNDKLN